jgi:acyl-CoA reductase-like NAD-dependent aldehyde dehydrogenase
LSSPTNPRSPKNRSSSQHRARNDAQRVHSATRAYVHRSIYEAFLPRRADLFNGVRVGDPFDPITDLGTLISDAQVLRVEGFVDRAVKDMPAW